MLYDIFKKFRSLKKKKKQNPKIIVDIHEKNSLVPSELDSFKDVEIEFKNLKIADYIIGSIAIERKTIYDLWSSIVSKRIFEQLRNMQKYKQRFLIIEGDLDEFYEDKKINPNSIRGFVLSVFMKYGAFVIFSRDFKESSEYLVCLAKQEVKPKTEITLHSRIPKTLDEQKRYVLESFPKIGPKKSKKLLEKFGSLKKIFNASEEDLREVLKKDSEIFRKIIEE